MKGNTMTTLTENIKALEAKIQRLEAKQNDTPAARKCIQKDRTRDLRAKLPAPTPAEWAHYNAIGAAIHRAWRKLERLQA